MFYYSDRIVWYLACNTETDLNRRYRGGSTPLIQAIDNNDYKIVEMLKLCGVDLNIASSDGNFPLHFAVYSASICQFLLQNGADINAVNRQNSTALHKAVQTSCTETVYILLHYNADTNILDSAGYNPFLLAIEYHATGLQNILFEYSNVWYPATALDSALKYRSPYRKIILEKCTVVSSHTLRIFFDVLRHVQTDFPNDVEWMFKKIWANNDSKKTINLREICSQHVPNKVKLMILETIVNSPKKQFLEWLQHQSSNFLFDMIEITFTTVNITMDLLTKIVFRTLENSSKHTLKVKHIKLIFDLYGDCKLLKSLRYMDYTGSWLYEVGSSRLMSSIIFDIETDVSSIKYRFALAKLFTRPFFYPYLEYETFLRFCTDNNNRIALYNNWDIPSSRKVPSLLELARDQSRKHIVQTFNLIKSSHYHTIVNELPISPYLKAVLRFEQRIY